MRLYKDVEKFFKRLRCKYSDFDYLSIIESQERNAWHCYILLRFSDFNDIWVKSSELEKIWGNRFVWIKDLMRAKNGKSCDNVAAYLIKYMNKDLFDERLMGQQAYLRSRNLKEPEAGYENLTQDELFKKYGLKVEFKDICDLQKWGKKQNYFYLDGFDTKENGHCDYMEFNKKRMISE